MRDVDARECELAARLIGIAEAMVANRTAGLSAEAIRSLPEEVKQLRWHPRDDGGRRLIDAEAACLVELVTALAYARDAGDAIRESRMVMFLNTFITFLRQDLARAVA